MGRVDIEGRLAEIAKQVEKTSRRAVAVPADIDDPAACERSWRRPGRPLDGQEFAALLHAAAKG